jgi:hypothetical protein
VSTNNLEGLRNVGRQGGEESKKPLVAELDYSRINIPSIGLRGVTATIVEDKPTFDLKTINIF